MTGPERASQPLNELRDELARGLRALVADACEALPDDAKGIAGRIEPLLRAQLPHLERLCALDLDTPGAVGEEEMLEVLTRVQHLPRVIASVHEVLRTEQQCQALAQPARDATRLAQKLEALLYAWALRAGLL